MRLSQFKKNKINDLKQRAILLYKSGLATRDVGILVGRSHTWVANTVKTLSPDLDIDKSLQ